MYQDIDLVSCNEEDVSIVQNVKKLSQQSENFLAPIGIDSIEDKEYSIMSRKRRCSANRENDRAKGTCKKRINAERAGNV